MLLSVLPDAGSLHGDGPPMAGLLHEVLLPTRTRSSAMPVVTFVGPEIVSTLIVWTPLWVRSLGFVPATTFVAVAVSVLWMLNAFVPLPRLIFSVATVP